MFGVPLTGNSVYISTIQTGCCKIEFDSTYPVHLNGIINQQEFHQSIKKINRALSSRIKKFLILFFILNIIVSMICFLFGGISSSSSHTTHFPPLIAFGMGLSIIGSIIFIIAVIIVQLQQTSRLRQVIAEESMKYSMRSPTPCSWRLETTRTFFGTYGNGNRNIVYHLIIDIGRSSASESGAYQSAYFAGQTNQYFSSPPTYSGTSTTVCQRCGAAWSDHSARFCPSCGQPFNKS